MTLRDIYIILSWSVDLQDFNNTLGGTFQDEILKLKKVTNVEKFNTFREAIKGIKDKLKQTWETDKMNLIANDIYYYVERYGWTDLEDFKNEIDFQNKIKKLA